MVEFRQEGKLEIAEGKGWQLGVAEKFKKLSGENPSLVPTILKLKEELELAWSMGDDNLEREESELRLTFIKHTKYSTIFKLEVGDRIFFLKTNRRRNQGFIELENIARVQTLLKGKSGVRVVNYQLGYQDNSRSFFVAEWTDSKMLGDFYNPQLREHFQIDGEKWKEVRARFGSLRRFLTSNGFSDLHDENVFYDSLTDELVFYDIESKG